MPDRREFLSLAGVGGGSALLGACAGGAPFAGAVAGGESLDPTARALLDELREIPVDDTHCHPLTFDDAQTDPDEFIERHFDAAPTAGVWAGRHEYDGRLPDVSAEAVERRAAMLRDYARRAREEFPGNSLTGGEALEREHLIAAIDGRLFGVEVAQYHRRNPAWYAGTISPSVYVSRDYASRAVRLEALTAYLRNLPAYLQQMRGMLQPRLD